MNPLRRTATRRTAAVAGLAALALGLAACSGDTATESTQTSAASAESSQAEALVLEDGWAKASEGMTGVFGTLKNNGTEKVTVTGGSSPAAGRIETHTMVNKDGAMVRVKDEDGFDVPAGGVYKLEPGGDHIMLIDLKEPLTSGTEVTLTITTSEGTEATVTVPVREFSGADEEYLPGEGHGSESMTDGSMTHDSMTHDSSGSGTMSPSPSMPSPVTSSN